MYSRTNGDATYTFEPSGGLLNASLVMQDRETDSYWSIITDEAIYGKAQGQALVQVPGSVKTTWGDWKQLHPQSKVLSVEGVEHQAESPYDRYFASDEGFRGLGSADGRLSDKALLFGFHRDGRAYAVPFEMFEKNGGVLSVAGRPLFLYRQAKDSFYRSTTAYVAPEGLAFIRKKKRWVAMMDDTVVARFDPQTRSFRAEAGGVTLEPFHGFDTYWYIWSLNNPETGLLLQ